MYRSRNGGRNKREGRIVAKTHQIKSGAVIVFNDEMQLHGFEEGVQSINKTLKEHGLQINATFLEDYESEDVCDVAHYIIIEKTGKE